MDDSHIFVGETRVVARRGSVIQQCTGGVSELPLARETNILSHHHDGSPKQC